MSRGNRWGYMANPRFNPPNNDCPECEAPSKTFHVGGRTVEGVTEHRYTCEHGHTWTQREPPAGGEPSRRGAEPSAAGGGGDT